MGADEIAERLRREPYRLFRSDCITKSFHFRRECRARGIDARAVVCLGYYRAEVLGRRVNLPVIHGWGEVAKVRFETSRLLGSRGTFGVIPVNIRPLAAVRF